MRTYNFFIVEVDKVLKDTITTSGGLELYLDGKFNDFEHRTQCGTVVAAPFKYDHGVSVGDELYFHHNVTLNNGQPLTGYDNHYLVSYNDNDAIASQAIAFKSKETGEVKVLSSWALVEQIQESRDESSDSIEIVTLKEKPVTKGRIAIDTDATKELGLKVGDIVGFKKNMDYDMIVDGKPYGRVRAQDLLYVQEEVHND
tara:strand:- start:437 stop:1036 length:600 start_codon:yes stop_codon:yes gene_type:complete